MTSPQKHDGTTAADREIHRLFDGDLSTAEREALLTALRASGQTADARSKLEGLGEVRAVVREAALAADPEALDADALWAQIAARVEGASADARPSAERVSSERVSSERLSGERLHAERLHAERTGGERAGERPPAKRSERGAPAAPGLRVIDGGASGAPAPAAANERPGEGDARERERRVRQRRGMIMLVGGLAAAAAAVIAIVRPGEAPVEDPVVAVHSDDDGVAADPLIDPLTAEQLRRTEVLAVDFGANVGTVFSVEGAGGSRYAVVWLTDEAEKAPEAPSREGSEPAPGTGEGAPEDTAHL